MEAANKPLCCGNRRKLPKMAMLRQLDADQRVTNNGIATLKTC
jgi:hypothetical protein